MKRIVISLPLLTMLITSLLLCFPVQRIQAIGPNLTEGSDGFTIAVNDTWTMAIRTLVSSGDKIETTITTMNNSIDSGTCNLTSGWIADMIWATGRYYNSTSQSWTSYSESLIAAYNSTTPITAYNVGGMYNYTGQYYSWGLNIIPQNYTTANHTIVNLTYSAMAVLVSFGFTFSYTAPTPPSISGTWDITVGNASTPGSSRITYSYNSKGVLILSRQYLVITSGWILVMEQKLIGEDGRIPIELLLLTMGPNIGGGVGLGTSGVFIIIGISLLVVGAIIITAVVKSRH